MLVLMWVYILIAGAPPSAIRAGVVATLVFVAGLLGRQVSALHFMTTMLAAVLAYNPLLVYNTGFQLSVAAVFGILLLRKPLKSLVETTLLRFFKKPGPVSNLLSVSLAAQIATAPIAAAAFEEVSVIGALTNLVAVPLSGPILTLGLLGSVRGNVTPALAYPLNASNGFLVTILEWVARTASASALPAVTTPGSHLPWSGSSTSAASPPPSARRRSRRDVGLCGPQSSSSGRRCGSRSWASAASSPRGGARFCRSWRWGRVLGEKG